MYARDVENYPEPLTFGVSGKLIMNVLVMYDRQTETYWSQILGEAVEGELAGTKLTPLAALQTTWSQWKELHPDSRALRKGYFGARDPYISYYEGGDAGVIGETRKDPRLPTKTLGVGFVLDEQSAYFPFAALTETPVINDAVADTPVLLVFRSEAATGVVYRRTVEGQTLTFSLDPIAELQPTLIDAETGSHWSGFNGVAFEGPLAGTTLERIPSTTSFWFGWKDWHPDTYLYEAE